MGVSGVHDNRDHSDYLFVYGTLRSRLRHRVRPLVRAQDLRLVAPAYVHGELYDLGAYPGAVRSTDQTRIYGELLEVRRGSINWRIIDAYEDYQPHNEQRSLFVRGLSTAWHSDDSTPMVCWVYWYNRSTRGRRRISCGDYLFYLEKR